MNLRFSLFSVVLAIGWPLITAAQHTAKPTLSLEAGTFLSSDKTNPFWVRSNQFGEIPLKSPGFTIRAQAAKNYVSPKNKKFSYGYGARAVLNVGTTTELIMAELYGKVKYGAIEFYAGRRRETFGLVDSLSMGSYIWSGNALPMPKVQISIPNYTPILKNGFIAIKGNYAHGWIGTDDSIKNYFLHQKSLYVRLGKPGWRFKVHGGFNHQVQWGGTLLYPRIDRGVRVTKYGTDLQTYGYVVSAKSLYSDSGGGDSLVVVNGQASAEGGNRVGNHLGTFDLGIEYEDQRSRWFFYRQSIYEAGALFYLNNIADGLNGVSFSRKNAKQGILKVVVEYLHTSSQGGEYPAGRVFLQQLRGQEDYFNNGRYLDGWVYKRQTIGTPFLMPLTYTTGLSQTLITNPNRIVNNRVNAFSISIKSRIKRIDLLTRLSVSENLGSYDIPLNVSQTSVQQQVIFPVKAYTVTLNVGYDTGGVLKQNIGAGLFVKRYF
jgi:hypothetical protein